MSKQTVEQLMAELEAARIENAKLKANQKKEGTISFKVSAKGAVSVYGLGRFPVTLYDGQWSRFFTKIDELKAFIEANKSLLTTKEQSLAEKAKVVTA